MKMILMAAIAACALAFTTGCEKEQTPAEKTGSALSGALDSTKKAAADAADATKKAADDTKKAVDKAAADAQKK